MCNGRLSKGALIMINLAFATRKSKFRQKIVLLKSFRQAWPTQHLPSCVSKSKKTRDHLEHQKKTNILRPIEAPKSNLLMTRTIRVTITVKESSATTGHLFLGIITEENFIPLKSISISRVTQIITHIHYLAFWHNCPGSTDS